MPQSPAKIHLHIVFSTKNRFPFLDSSELRKEMHSYLGGTLNELNWPVLTVGGPADHVHILCLLSKNMSLADFIGEIKRSSSKWVKTKGLSLRKFGWQNGYGAFSVSQSHVERVRACIRGQLRAFFKAYDVHYDERYVWGLKVGASKEVMTLDLTLSGLFPRCFHR